MTNIMYDNDGHHLTFSLVKVVKNHSYKKVHLKLRQLIFFCDVCPAKQRV